MTLIRILFLPLALLLILGPVAAAEEGVGGGEVPEKAASLVKAEAAILFQKAVDTWLAVYKQTLEEPDLVSLLDELAREKGFKGYAAYSADAKKRLGGDWDRLLGEKLHEPFARAKLKLAEHMKKLKEREKAGKKDPRKFYVPDKEIIVYLKNGSTIEGIARKGVVSEKRVRVRKKGAKKIEEIYLQVPAREKDAGVRVWYVNMTDGFTFIPYSLIELKKGKGVEIVRTLTPVESEQIFKDIQSREKELKAAEKKAKAVEAQMDKEREAAAKAMREAQIAKQKGMDVEKARAERKRLLSKFPPAAGWGSQKLAEIRRRWIINHIPPTAEEREFLALYEKWKKAKEEQAAIDGKKGG